MDVDQRVVVQDLRMMRGYESHTAHVGGEGIHFVDPASGSETVLPSPKIQQQELIGIALRILRRLLVDTTNPVSLLLQECDEMMSDEAARASDQNPRHRPLSSPLTISCL